MSNGTNTTNLLIPPSQPTMLPLQTCGRRSVDGTIPPRWRRACAANYCTFSATPYVAENLTSTWLETNCSHFSDFDVYSHESVFLVYPNSCARLQFGGINETTACYGTSSLPYDATYGAAAPGVVCHVDYYSPNLPYVRAGTECRGQYCFISATVQGDVYRGCATVYQDPTETRIMAVSHPSFVINKSLFLLNHIVFQVGFYRSYNAIEQWICQSDYCNYDLRAAERSWPETLAPYRNISHLQQFNVFYVINEDKSCPPFLGVTLAIAGLIISSVMVN
ncbi:hypothetical protein WR25_19495 isoform B [Diploscapter pachys]|uniref:DUF7622 domain-containing protein n=1 Tax=Diploscapter pachys TaxID=2018661 RepID=A0A2A2K0K8_9BILA|nr:hypothetical protein WR25_19495 isoform B [Diploscapter pachys]